MAEVIMVQGTMSNAGKSILVTGLCRLFAQDGYEVAPFKSQNMALNSFITADGGEMGRAQVVQAEAAGKEPVVAMNPILLKPVTDKGSQVIVNGRSVGVKSASEYFATRASLMPTILDAFESLASDNDIIVIEGAGSPAEINLRADDIVNMGLAKLLHAPVLLVGDIDRGGVFAQLYGTCALLPDDESALIRGLVINKFRGDVTLLADGLTQLEELTDKPVLGVVPYLDIDIDDEDSLSERLSTRSGGEFHPSEQPESSRMGHKELDRGEARAADIAVIRFPRVSNFTDFTALGATAGLSVRYVDSVPQLGQPDLLVLPGTRNTIADLRWLRERGLDGAISDHARAGRPVIGICGGYQMLGRVIADPEGVEGGGTVAGLGLLPVATEFHPVKTQVRSSGTVLPSGGGLSMSGARVEGYEIHMGTTELDIDAAPLVRLDDGSLDGCRSGSVCGTYLHGFFDTASIREALRDALGAPMVESPFDYGKYRQRQYDLLADALRDHLDVDAIYAIMGVQR